MRRTVFGFSAGLLLAAAVTSIMAGDPPTGQPLPVPANPVRLVTAAECPAGRVVLTGSQAVGVVVERGDPPADAIDQTGTVRVLVIQPGNGGTAAGSVATLGGLELVVDLGQLQVRPAATTPVLVGNGN